jgi:hypothetical protein
MNESKPTYLLQNHTVCRISNIVGRIPFTASTIRRERNLDTGELLSPRCIFGAHNFNMRTALVSMAFKMSSLGTIQAPSNAVRRRLSI